MRCLYVRLTGLHCQLQSARERRTSCRRLRHTTRARVRGRPLCRHFVDIIRWHSPDCQLHHPIISWILRVLHFGLSGNPFGPLGPHAQQVHKSRVPWVPFPCVSKLPPQWGHRHSLFHLSSFGSLYLLSYARMSRSHSSQQSNGRRHRRPSSHPLNPHSSRIAHFLHLEQFDENFSFISPYVKYFLFFFNLIVWVSWCAQVL